MTDSTEKTYTVFESQGQLKITLPRVIAQALGIRRGDKIKYLYDRGELVIRRVN